MALNQPCEFTDGPPLIARVSISALGLGSPDAGELVLFDGTPRRLHANWSQRSRLPARVERYLIAGAAPTLHLAGLVLECGSLDCLWTAYDQVPIPVPPLPPGQLRLTVPEVLQAMPTNILGLISQTFGFESAGYHLSLGKRSRDGALLGLIHAAQRGRAALVISRPETSEAACIVCSGASSENSSAVLELNPQRSLLDQVQAATRSFATEFANQAQPIVRPSLLIRRI